MENTVNQRFINLVNYIINSNLAKNKSEIAEKINISSNKLSAILVGRNNAGVDNIIGLCESYNINYEYVMTGRGEIYRKNFAEPRNLLNPESVVDYLIMNTEKLLENKKFRIWYDNIYTKGAFETLKEDVKGKYDITDLPGGK